MKYDIIKKSYLASFDIDDKIIKDLIIINTKCLVDNNMQRFVFIDENRLRDELVYHRFYGQKPSYNNILNILLPIILANTNIQKSEDEVVKLIQKYIKYLKKEEKLFDYIIGAVMYNSIIHNLLENKDIKYAELLQKVKEKIIGFSIELNKLNTIKFQMARINAIQNIDNYIDLKFQEYDDEKIVLSILNILYDIYIEDRDTINSGIEGMKKSILSILGEDVNSNIDNIDFILSMAQYIIKLRDYKINKTLYNNNSDPRKLISLNEGDNIMDPILNQITVISKSFNNNILNLKIKSKSGNYTFKFKKA
ncbi:hypothetical protein CHF27_004780 [Romboutsia maritimum]|uniref:Uncharacterized protein n=1 Tax=Romboutsia maritimum TaxID=2020948 RepID=A0A255I3S9_9FIRM|nr:hypothetical protein [Romboutsia maritimum]RDY24134.1 hypothetical protein CHF27_004780 [Romboutsia maritimum]